MGNYENDLRKFNIDRSVILAHDPYLEDENNSNRYNEMVNDFQSRYEKKEIYIAMEEVGSDEKQKSLILGWVVVLKQNFRRWIMGFKNFLKSYKKNTYKPDLIEELRNINLRLDNLDGKIKENEAN